MCAYWDGKTMSMLGFHCLYTKKAIFIFLALKLVYLWSAYQETIPKLYQLIFKENYTTLYVQITIWLRTKWFIGTSQ
jgi:hypothetical protein